MAQRGRKTSNKKIVTPNMIYCPNCEKEKKASEFYVSLSVYHANTGKVQFCKDCCISMSCDNKGVVDIERLKFTLQKIDKPFLYDVLQSAYEESKNSENNTHPLQLYFKNINSLVQYKGLTWKDSIFNLQGNISEKNIGTSKIGEYIVTDELVDKWGDGYSPEEYYHFEKKWKKLIDNYGEKTSFHVEGLITYIRFRVKEELSTAKGDIREAKEWANMAAKAAEDAKINVRQLSKSDISGGVELIPQIFEAVESKVGVISIMPKLKEQPYDDADIIIWCIVNYTRRLEDKSRVEYKDIWNFYDEMLREYYKAQGYSEETIQKEKQKRNNIFKDLGKVYKEPIYEDGDT